MLTTLSGISASTRFSQPERRPVSIVESFSGNVIDTISLHLWKALLPIVRTESGTYILVKAEQPKNAHPSILISVCGSVIDLRCSQAENAPYQKVVTLSGTANSLESVCDLAG